jgi:hypothetical protein
VTRSLCALGHDPSVSTNGPGSAAAPQTASSAQPNPAPYEHWITGEIFSRDGILLFRTDKDVQGDSEKNVVVLGCTRAGMYTLLPLYAKAAEKHLRARLYGVLQARPETMPGHAGVVPNVEFITWKLHAPTDPDVLPSDQRLIINLLALPPPGYTVKSFRPETNGAPAPTNEPMTGNPSPTNMP